MLCDETEITLYGTRIPRVGGNVISQGCEDAPGDKSLGLLMGTPSGQTTSDCESKIASPDGVAMA